MTSGSLSLYCFNFSIVYYCFLLWLITHLSIYLFSVYLYLSHDRIRTPFLTNAIIPILPSPQHTQYGVTIGEKVTSAGWQATLCDPIWHVSSRSGVAG